MHKALHGACHTPESCSLNIHGSEELKSWNKMHCVQVMGKYHELIILPKQFTTYFRALFCDLAQTEGADFLSSFWVSIRRSPEMLSLNLTMVAVGF
jgi:hypothetical protein